MSSDSGRLPFAAATSGDVGTAAFEAHTVLMAGKLRRKLQKLLVALVARVSDSAVLWGSCARFYSMHGNVDGALTAKQTQCRLLKSRPDWKKTAAVYAQMIAATLDLCELYIAEVCSSAYPPFFPACCCIPRRRFPCSLLVTLRRRRLPPTHYPIAHSRTIALSRSLAHTQHTIIRSLFSPTRTHSNRARSRASLRQR